MVLRVRAASSKTSAVIGLDGSYCVEVVEEDDHHLLALEVADRGLRESLEVSTRIHRKRHRLLAPCSKPIIPNNPGEGILPGLPVLKAGSKVCAVSDGLEYL